MATVCQDGYYGDPCGISASLSAYPLTGSDDTDTVEARRDYRILVARPYRSLAVLLCATTVLSILRMTASNP